jgi:serine/threonine protein kinase
LPRGDPSSWAEPTRAWGSVVADPRWLGTDRLVRVIANRVGEPVSDVASKLLEIEVRRRYLLLDRLAKTRRCTVFGAVDLLLAREVVVKILHDTDEQTTWRLIHEAQAVATFDHRHVVRVYDVGVHDEWVYAVMDRCDTHLDRWRAGRPWTEVLDRLVEAGHGLAAVHAAGLVHRDVKPDNILIKNGVAKLADFGLATPPGWTGRIAGTPGYIAPEAADGYSGPAGDVFAFGCTAWRCLVGSPPFGEPPPNAGTSAATLVLVARARQRRPEVVGAPATAVPPVVLAALGQALGAEPSRRPTLDELLEQLAALRSAGALRRQWWALRQSAHRTRSASRKDEVSR